MPTLACIKGIAEKREYYIAIFYMAVGKLREERMAHEELKEFSEDFANLLIGLLPASTILSVSKFIHKWVIKKRVINRVHGHIKRQMRIRHIKHSRNGKKALWPMFR